MVDQGVNNIPSIKTIQKYTSKFKNISTLNSDILPKGVHLINIHKLKRNMIQILPFETIIMSKYWKST